MTSLRERFGEPVEMVRKKVRPHMDSMVREEFSSLFPLIAQSNAVL